MKNILLLFLFCLSGLFLSAQSDFLKSARQLEPPKSYDNIHVEKLFSDAQASVFVIWVKKKVRRHKHMQHSETVYILKGKGLMQVGNEQIPVRKGDVIFIPEGTPHAVTVSSKLLKVVSVQAPEFKGQDRIFLDQ